MCTLHRFSLSRRHEKYSWYEDTRPRGPFLESPETFRAHFGWYNSLCIFKTKASRGTKLCGYFYFYSLYNIWKDQLYRISGSEFYEWLFGPEKFSGLTRNGLQKRNNSLTQVNTGQWIAGDRWPKRAWCWISIHKTLVQRFIFARFQHGGFQGRFFLDRRWTGSSSSLCACVQDQMWIWGSLSTISLQSVNSILLYAYLTTGKVLSFSFDGNSWRLLSQYRTPQKPTVNLTAECQNHIWTGKSLHLSLVTCHAIPLGNHKQGTKSRITTTTNSDGLESGLYSYPKRD